MNVQRRKYVKLMAGVVGSSILSGCGNLSNSRYRIYSFSIAKEDIKSAHNWKRSPPVHLKLVTEEADIPDFSDDEISTDLTEEINEVDFNDGFMVVIISDWDFHLVDDRNDIIDSRIDGDLILSIDLYGYDESSLNIKNEESFVRTEFWNTGLSSVPSETKIELQTSNC